MKWVKSTQWAARMKQGWVNIWREEGSRLFAWQVILVDVEGIADDGMTDGNFATAKRIALDRYRDAVERAARARGGQ